jgi:hypothetical protein
MVAKLVKDLVHLEGREIVSMSTVALIPRGIPT